MRVKVIEMTAPIGPWLVRPVTAIIKCTPEEATELPGVVWHGIAACTGGEYRAHLEGHDIETANAIMALDCPE